MQSRISVVGTVKVNAVQSSSVFQIGDSFIYTPKTRGYAIAQLSPFFTEEPYAFNDPVFHEPIPKPTLISRVQQETFHESPYIHTGNVKVTSLGDSSILQIGSTKYTQSEARIKHVRRL